MSITPIFKNSKSVKCSQPQASSKLGKITSAHDTSQDPKLSKEVAVSAEELEQQRHKVKSAAERIREKLKKELDEVGFRRSCPLCVH